MTGDGDDAIPGFVLTRGSDRYGRCVALAGRGDPPAASGEATYVDVELLTHTANHHLIATGLAYPTFYLKLWPDLRGELAARSLAARPASGVWAEDRTLTGVTVTGLDGLSDDAVILPKLFRRLADYLALNGGDPSLAGLPAYLAQRDDRVLILSTGHYTGFDFVVAVDGQSVRLTRPPEDLVFQEA